MDEDDNKPIVDEEKLEEVRSGELDEEVSVGMTETAEDPESKEQREAAEYEDTLNELHDELDSIKSTGRELHEALHHKADEAETMQGEKRFRRLAGSAYNLFGRLRDGDQEVLRGGINVED